ncbi:MAG: hypothetical protein U5N58_07980 [Actinomycetota bacterium]|nr:hypothetical protein [Actinomycetota bacterium]
MLLDRPGGRVSGRTDINIFVHLNLDTEKSSGCYDPQGYLGSHTRIQQPER